MSVIKQQTKTIITDNKTGEILETTENTTSQFPSEPAYVKLYIKDLIYLKDLPRWHTSVLMALLKRVSYASDGLEISLTPGTKRLMLKELSLKNIRSINNALSDFVKTKILFRIETGVYKFNPYLFGKGDWQDISKLRLTIDYTLEGKSFESVLIDYNLRNKLNKNNKQNDSKYIEQTLDNIDKK